MENFVWVWQVESSVEAIDDDEETTAGAFHAADQYDDDVAVGVDVQGMGYAVIDLSHAQDLLHDTDDYFNRCELDELVEDVKWWEKYQVPKCNKAYLDVGIDDMHLVLCNGVLLNLLIKFFLSKIRTLSYFLIFVFLKSLCVLINSTIFFTESCRPRRFDFAHSCQKNWEKNVLGVGMLLCICLIIN